jgi:hypothetical protein
MDAAALPSGRSPGGTDTAAAIAPRHVMENWSMPTTREPDAAAALGDADPLGAPATGDDIRPVTSAAAGQPRTRRPADRRSRPQRWREAVVELLALQAEYAKWLAALPDSLSDSPTAEALEAIVDLDLTELAEIEPPRGFGRD